MFALFLVLIFGFSALYFFYIRGAKVEDKTSTIREALAEKKYETLHVDPSPLIYLAKSTILGAGRGMFAKRDIKKGETIEICPVVTFSSEEQAILKMTKLRNHFFSWEKNQAALCLGFGSLYNHSTTPNAEYLHLPEKNILQFIASRDIQKDEEITHNYGWSPLLRNKNEVPDF